MGILGSFGGVMGSSMRASWAASEAISRHTANAVDERSVRRAQKSLQTTPQALRSGYLFPGEQAGADARGLMDYRGLETPERIAGALRDGVVSLGRLKNPRTGFSADAWLPWEVLNTHVAIIAPNGSGKTHGLVVPWILSFVNAGGRVIANDVKGDLLQNVLMAKQKLDMPGFKVTRWNPFNKKASVRWNPLSEVTDDASRVRLASAVVGDPDKVDSKDRFFVERDQRWLDGLIKLALGIVPTASFNDIYVVLCDKPTLDALIRDNPSLSGNISELLGMSDMDYSLAIGSLKNKLMWLTYDNPRYVTRESDFRLDEIIESPGLLLIGSPLSEGEPAKAASAMVFAMLRSVTFQRFGMDGLPNIWMLDEAATIAERIALDDTLAVARSANVGIVLAFQDVTQLGNEEKQNRYLANCRTMITLRDVADATATHFGKRLGQHTVQKVSTSLDARGRHMPQVATETVPMLGPTEISRPPADFGTYCGIVHCPPLGPLCRPAAVTSQPFIVDLLR